MPRIRRLAAALSSVLLLQLTLLGSSAPCAPYGGEAPRRAPAHHAPAPTPSARSAHVAHPSNDSAEAGSAADDARSAGTHGCDAPPDGAPVTQGTPADCLTMAACAIAAPVAPVVTVVAGRAVALDLPDPERYRSGPTAAPELPPPRA